MPTPNVVTAAYAEINKRLSALIETTRDEPSRQAIRASKRIVGKVLGLIIRDTLSPYPQSDGEWVAPLPGYLMQCCDCGLRHQMEFRIVDGRVQFRAWRIDKMEGGSDA